MTYIFSIMFHVSIMQVFLHFFVISFVKVIKHVKDTRREKLVLHWIQYKNSSKYKFGYFWRFSYVYTIN